MKLWKSPVNISVEKLYLTQDSIFGIQYLKVSAKKYLSYYAWNSFRECKIVFLPLKEKILPLKIG